MPTLKGKKTVRAWVHIALTTNEPHEVILKKERPKCGLNFGLDCMLPCTITYEVPKTPKPKRGKK
jgi:hypothetical protein